MDLAKNLMIDSVCRLHPAPPHHVSPRQTVADAVALMRREQMGSVLICENQRIEGIFTERDLMKRILAVGKPLTTPLADCMTPHPIVVHPKDSIATAIRRMEEGGHRHLPVVDEAGIPLGILSVKRIVHYLVEHFPATIYNLPPDPHLVPREAEGA
jgi:CBS domain-containing protein